MSEESIPFSLPQHQLSGGPPPPPSERPGAIHCADEVGVQSNPALAAEGWERRHLVDPERAEESIELYESLGFEVLAQQLTEEDFSETCRECASAICRTYVLLHTRRKKQGS